MKTLLLLLLNFAAICGVSAQSENVLLGKWEYSKLPDNASASELEKVSVASDFALQFSGKHRLSITETGREKLGSWEMPADRKVLSLSMDDGRIVEIPIVRLTDQELVITYRKNPVLLKKTSGKDPELREAVVMPTVPAKEGQLLGKWNLDGKASGVPMDLHFTFSQNGAVVIEYGERTDSGTWQLFHDNSAIKMIGKKDTSFLNIIKISDNELWLQRGSSNIILKMTK